MARATKNGAAFGGHPGAVGCGNTMLRVGTIPGIATTPSHGSALGGNLVPGLPYSGIEVRGYYTNNPPYLGIEVRGILN